MNTLPCSFPIVNRSLRLLALLVVVILFGSLTPAQVKADAYRPTYTCTPTATQVPSATPEPTATPPPTSTPTAAGLDAAPQSNAATAPPPPTETPSSVVSQTFGGKNAGLNQCLVGLIFVTSVIVMVVIVSGIHKKTQSTQSK